MLIAATAICLFAMVTGIWLSFHLDSAPAPTVILILTGLFLLAFARRVLTARTA
jgi:manganese/iron transport system permease protein